MTDTILSTPTLEGQGATVTASSLRDRARVKSDGAIFIGSRRRRALHAARPLRRANRLSGPLRKTSGREHLKRPPSPESESAPAARCLSPPFTPATHLARDGHHGEGRVAQRLRDAVHEEPLLGAAHPGVRLGPLRHLRHRLPRGEQAA